MRTLCAIAQTLAPTSVSVWANGNEQFLSNVINHEGHHSNAPKRNERIYAMSAEMMTSMETKDE